MITDRERKAWFRTDIQTAAEAWREATATQALAIAKRRQGNDVAAVGLSVGISEVNQIFRLHRMEARRIAREAGWLGWAYAPRGKTGTPHAGTCGTCKHLNATVAFCEARSNCANIEPPNLPGWEPE